MSIILRVFYHNVLGMFCFCLVLFVFLFHFIKNDGHVSSPTPHSLTFSVCVCLQPMLTLSHALEALFSGLLFSEIGPCVTFCSILLQFPPWGLSKYAFIKSAFPLLPQTRASIGYLIHDGPVHSFSLSLTVYVSVQWRTYRYMMNYNGEWKAKGHPCKFSSPPAPHPLDI